MKLALFATVSASIVKREDRALGEEKRYKQLVKMMKHYNPDFDERKYWAYGCHCLMLGDRPMSEMGHGKPVDGLDSVCRKYKECLKCARKKHGESCIGEFTKVNIL